MYFYCSLFHLAYMLLNFYRHFLEGKLANDVQKEAIGSRFWAVLVNSMYYFHSRRGSAAEELLISPRPNKELTILARRRHETQ